MDTENKNEAVDGEISEYTQAPKSDVQGTPKRPRRNTIHFVISCVCCILVFLSYLRINSLENQINNLQNNLSSQINNMSSAISGISGSVRAELEQQNSIIDSYGYTVDEYNPEAKTVSVTVTVAPKQYTTSTTATLVIKGTEYALTKNAGAFSATIEVPLSNSSAEDARFVMTDGNTKSTESVSLWYDIASEITPQINAYFSGGWSGGTTKTDGSITFDYDGSLDLYIDSPHNKSINIASAKLCVDINGKTVSSEDISFDIVDSYHYEAYVPCSGKPVIPANGTIDIYVLITDESGLTYKRVAMHEAVDGKGNMIDQSSNGATSTGGTSSTESATAVETYRTYIYDKNNNLLYSTD